MKNEKHVALAAQILEGHGSGYNLSDIAYRMLSNRIAAALQQVETEALASKVRLPDFKSPAPNEEDSDFCEGYNAAINDMRKLNGSKE